MLGLCQYIGANANPSICSHHIHAVMTIYSNGDAGKPVLLTLLENVSGVQINGQALTDLSNLADNVDPNVGTDESRAAELQRQHAVMMAFEMDVGADGNTPNEIVTETILRNRLNMPLLA